MDAITNQTYVYGWSTPTFCRTFSIMLMFLGENDLISILKFTGKNIFDGNSKINLRVPLGPRVFTFCLFVLCASDSPRLRVMLFLLCCRRRRKNIIVAAAAINRAVGLFLPRSRFCLPAPDAAPSLRPYRFVPARHVPCSRLRLPARLRTCRS